MIRFSTHSLKPAALTRYWNTVLTVVNQLPASAALYFWVGKERGEFVASLRNLRAGLLTAIANGKVVIEASRLAGVAGTTPPSVGELAAAQASVHEAKGHLASWNVLASDFREVYLAVTPQVGMNAMPGWWHASWCRGALADDDDGSYRAAANVELYTPGRLDHAVGLAAGGPSHTFTKQVVNVTRREALKMVTVSPCVRRVARVSAVPQASSCSTNSAACCSLGTCWWVCDAVTRRRSDEATQ